MESVHKRCVASKEQVTEIDWCDRDAPAPPVGDSMRPLCSKGISMLLRATRTLPILFLLLCIHYVINVHGWQYQPCTGSLIRRQFALPDCQLPPANPNLLLTQASWILAHDSATGYIVPHQRTASGLAWWYAKNQVGSAHRQLQDGARALDLRVRLFRNASVGFHHGGVPIHSLLLEQLLEDAIQWSRENPNELVLLFHSHFAYENSTEASDMVSSLSNVYNKYGIAYVTCDEAYELTIGDALELGAVSNADGTSSGGAILAMDKQDGTGYFCGKENWVESKLVTCYPRKNLTCTKQPATLLADLDDYLWASVDPDNPTDSAGTLGPPASATFWQAQAMWQVTAKSAAIGLSRLSNLLLDVRKSDVNRHVGQLLHQGFPLAASDATTPLNLVTLDNIAIDGNAILSVLRTQCGQYDNSAMDLELCGKDLAPPAALQRRLFHRRWGIVEFWGSLLLGIYLLATAIRLYLVRPRWLLTLISRIQTSWCERTCACDEEDPTVLAEETRKQGLLT